MEMKKSWIWPIAILGGIIYVAKKAAANAQTSLVAKKAQIDRAVDGGAVYTPEAVTQTAPQGYNTVANNGGIL